MIQWRQLVPVVLLLLTTGCRDQCDPSSFPASCEGNVAVYCPQPGPDQLVPLRIARKDCGERVCVSAGESVFCALEAEPNPLCVEDRSSVCEDDDSRLYCSRGFATSQTPCLTCTDADAGYADCQGGPASKCTADVQCAPGLECNENGYCYGATTGREG
jgi:hypothetical protein